MSWFICIAVGAGTTTPIKVFQAQRPKTGLCGLQGGSPTKLEIAGERMVESRPIARDLAGELRRRLTPKRPARGWLDLEASHALTVLDEILAAQ